MNMLKLYREKCELLQSRLEEAKQQNADLVARNAEQGEQLRHVEDAARGALSDLAGLLSEQPHDDEGCYKYDGQSAWDLQNVIEKTRLIFDGFDDNHKKLIKG